MCKVLIMGGSYFIGRKLVERLLEINDFELYVLNRGTVSLPYQSVHQLIADRNEIAQMQSALRGITFDYVVDLSCMQRSHVDTLSSSLELSNLKKIIHISSSAVYQLNCRSTAFLEHSPLGGNLYWGDYGLNKLEAENAYTGFAEQYGIKCCILRPPYVYGEYNYARRESFVFDHILSNRPIFVPQRNSKLQFIYVRDLCEIVFKLLSNYQTSLVEIYNVGNDLPITMLDWVELCGTVIGVLPNAYFYTGERYQAKQFFPFHDYDNYLDVTNIKKIHAQETPMQDGLKYALEWFYTHRSNIVFNMDVSKIEDEIWHSNDWTVCEL